MGADDRKEPTVHLSQGCLDGHVHRSEVRVRSHDTHDTAGRRVEAGRDNAQNDILAREDAGDGTLILNQNSRGVVLLHHGRSLLDRRPHAHSGRRDAVEDGLQRGAGHLGSKSLNVLNDLLGLAGAKLGLHALQGIVELPRRRVGTLKFLHGVVEALGDIEDTGNVLVLVHDGQVAEALADHQVESVGGAGVGSGTEGVLGHDLGDRDVGGLLPHADDTEGKILCRKDTGDTFVIVGNEDAVFSLGGHQLSSLGDGGVGLDLERGARLEGKDGAGGRLSSVPGAVGQVLLLGEVALELLADGLIAL
jgi:hypothetical protein